MALTQQDRDSVTLIATEVGRELGKSQLQAMQMLVQHHQDTCPHGRQLFGSKKFLLGVLVGLGLLSAGGSTLGSALGPALMKLLMGP